GPDGLAVGACEQLAKAAADGVAVVHGAAALADALAALPPPAFRRADPRLDLVRLTSRDCEVLVAINGCGEPLAEEVRFEGEVTLTGVWRPERLAGNGRVVVTLDQWAVQIWEVHR